MEGEAPAERLRRCVVLSTGSWLADGWVAGVGGLCRNPGAPIASHVQSQTPNPKNQMLAIHYVRPQ